MTRPGKSTSRASAWGRRRREVSDALAAVRRGESPALPWGDKVLTLAAFAHQPGSFDALIRTRVGVQLATLVDRDSHYRTYYAPFMVVNPRRILAVVTKTEPKP